MLIKKISKLDWIGRDYDKTIKSPPLILVWTQDLFSGERLGKKLC